MNLKMTGILSLALVSTSFFSPALGQVNSETKFNATFGRPDDKTNYSINQTIKFKEGNLEYRVISGVVVVSDDKGERTYIPVRLGVTANLDKSTTLTVLGGVDTALGDRSSLNALVGLQTRLSPDFRAGLSVETKGVMDSPESIEKDIRTINISPTFDWRLDKKTRLVVNYKLGVYSDKNTAHSVNARLSHELGDGLYSAANVFYHSVAKDLDNGYWSPSGYTLAGVELGWRFPIDKNLGLQVGIQPSYINNNGDQKFGVGGGAGARWNLGGGDNLELYVRGGYGVNVGGNLKIKL